ncbi:MAG: hypothetical protein LBK41_09645 [Clostridiales bacterium]|jgi:glutamate--cysteine ligase|nr:hypothetical protein [Clostridiales bacterium]
MDRAENALLDYFRAGIKSPLQPFRIGTEIEHFVAYTDTRRTLPYSDVADILRSLVPKYPREVSEGGKIIGCARKDAALSLEPGAQLELSVEPKAAIREIEDTYIGFLRDTAPLLGDHDAELVCAGYSPKNTAAETDMIPKVRYRFMDEHFARIGPMGRRMMRCTASCQYSVDYTSEDDFVRKFRLAYALSPILALLSDNAPTYEGKPNRLPLRRTMIWRGVDPARAGIVPGVFDEGFGFESYARFVLEAPAIFRRSGGAYISAEGRSARDIMNGTPDEYLPEAAELYTSLVFPDIRLRGYIELRPMDSVPPERFLAMAALVKGVFIGSERATFAEGVTERSVAAAQDAIANRGLSARVYNTTARALVRETIALAESNLPPDERRYLTPISPSQ